MPDAVEPTEPVVETPAAPAAPAAEPRNVREAIALRQSQGVPEIISTPDEPVATPAADTDPAAQYVADHPATPATPASPATEVDPYESFGGRQRVEDAIVLADAMRTEQGARLVVAQALHALGYDPNRVRAALEDQGATPQQAAEAVAEVAAAPVDPLAGLADDDVVTVADVRKLAAQIAQQQKPAETAPVADPRVDQIEQQLAASRQATATHATDTTLVELLGEPPADPAEQAQWREIAQGVLAEAQVGFDPNVWDPLAIRQAIIRGHQAFVANQERMLAAYAQRKAADRAKVPTHTGGAQVPSGDVPVHEPRNAKEATQQLKAAGLFK